MASLSEIRDGIQTVLLAAIPDVSVYAQVPDVTQLPAVVVMPARDSADFSGAMNRGLDIWSFDLYVLVALGEATVSQQALDQYVTGSGPRSLRQVFWDHDGLGLTDGTTAFAAGVREYGGKFQTARIDHVGAVVRLTVRTTGS